MPESLILWLILAAMTLAALALLLSPLLRRGQPPAADGTDHDLTVYRDQLAEVDRDLARGLLSAEEASAARLEIERRVLAAADRAAGAGAPARSPLALAVYGIAILLPVGALLTYAMLGAPGAPDRLADISGMPASEADGRLAELEQHTEDFPEDVMGWRALAVALVEAGRPGEAAQAFAAALDLVPGDGGLWASYGEALTLAGRGTVSPAARDAFAKALEIDADNPRARYYLSLALFQAGDPAGALEGWLSLEAASTEDAPWREVLATRIAEAAAAAGIDPATLDRGQPSPAETPMEGDQLAMIEGMVAGLASRLEENPEDVDGWLRLSRSYEVLERLDAARDAMAEAALRRPNDPVVQMHYGRLIYDAAGRPETIPEEVAAVMRWVLELEGNNGLALWFVGAASAQAGDVKAARDAWTALLGQLEPGTTQYENLKARIDALPQS